jgi:hypothetical protein
MKKILHLYRLLFYVFLLTVFSFEGVKAQVNELIGTWTVFEMTHLTNQETHKMTEDSLKINGLFEDYFFMKDAEFKETGNLSGHGSVSTEEGTWKITENKMIITLQLGERKFDVDYTWELKDKNLFLTRTFPNFEVIMALKKKQ